MKKLLFGLPVMLFAALLHAAASPNDTVVIAPSAATLTDAGGNVWGINATAPCTAAWAQKGQVSEVTKNGALDATSCEVAEIAYVNGVVWQENTGGAWYSYAATGWVAGNNPLPAASTYPASATLTWVAPSTYTTGAPITVALTYNVYCGTTAASLSKVATGLTVLTYKLVAASTSPTTFYCAVTALASGQESAQSNQVSTTIAAVPLIPNAPILTVPTGA